MGSITKGILGPVRGKVGTVVGSSWNGIEYIRAYVATRTSATSPAQETQQAKFALVNSFVKSMKPFLEISYKAAAKKMTGANAATSQIFRNAVTGIYPNFTINYPMVKVSAGTGLLNGAAPAALSSAPGVLNFNWTDNTGDNAKFSDKAMLVAYCAPLNTTTYNTAAAQRHDATAVLNVSAFSGQPVHTWIVFISEDGKRISDSHYTGMVTVQ